MNPTYITVKSWIVNNWSFTNQIIAMTVLDIAIKETKDVREIKQAIIAEMKKQNGICLVSA